MTMSLHLAIFLLACVAMAQVSHKYEQFHFHGRNEDSTASCQLLDMLLNAKTIYDNEINQTDIFEELKSHSLNDEEIVKLLEVCDFTSLYNIKGTVAAFDEFEDIILNCVGENTDQKSPKKDNEINKDRNNDNCDPKPNENQNLALLCTNSTPTESLNHVNTFFSNIGERLASNILNQSNTTESDLADAIKIDMIQSSFELKPTTEKEMLEILQSFYEKREPRYHYLLRHSVIVKAKHVLAPPITFITNLSLTTGVVPDNVKVSIVIPKFKKGDRNDPSNYRPISHVNFMSKVIDKVVKPRLQSYLETNDILSERQFGFRRGKSTKTAIAGIVKHITTQLDSRQKCIGIFFDLLKAFDTMSLPILLRKMKSVGIRGIALKWFQSYLENRKQRVLIGHTYSDFTIVNYGVSQGSPMSPSFFLIYFNDLLNLNLPQTESIAYADDTVIIIHGDTWETVTKIAQNNLEKVYRWLQDNLMSFQSSKTKFLTFSFSNLTAPETPISLNIPDCKKHTLHCKPTELERVHSTKYIGIIIDENLSWMEYIDYLKEEIKRLKKNHN